MPFLALSFDLAGRDASTAEGACAALGALAVTFADARDDAVLEPAPGEVRLWPATRIEALFALDEHRELRALALASALGLTANAVQQRIVDDRIWEREWLRDFRPTRFGRRLWISPLHAAVTERGATVVRLDPGLAFGTGQHATTALCLTWLDEHLSPGAQVIDYGCGSGILGIAAAVLGARAVECFDIDPQALTATAQNAAVNGASARLTVLEQEHALHTGADVLLANILAGPLIALAPRFAALLRTGGSVVLAGLLAEQEPEVTAAYSTWFDMHRYGAREEWVCLAGARRGT